MGLKGIKHPLTCFSSSSLRSDQSCPGGTKASFVSLGMGRIQGGSSVGFPIQLHSKTTVRFGPAQEKKHSGFVPSPAHTVRCNPRVHPSGSNPTSYCGDSRAKGREVARRRHEVTLAAREVMKRRREVEAWRREVEGWRRESTPASSSRTTSWNSVAAFSPVSAFRPPALSFFPLSGGRRVSRAQARAAGVMDRARPSWFMHLLYPSWCFMHLLVSLSVFFLPFN
jgi:hypothetical protein